MLDTTKEKLVSNWCQNRKNHNFKRNKILQTIDFKGFAKKSQKISTQLLTVLMFGAIIEAFQGKEERKDRIPKGTQKCISKVNRPQTNGWPMKIGGMTYDDGSVYVQ